MIPGNREKYDKTNKNLNFPIRSYNVGTYRFIKYSKTRNSRQKNYFVVNLSKYK